MKRVSLGEYKILTWFFNKMKTDKPYLIFWVGFFLIPVFYLPQFRELYIFPKWILIYGMALWASVSFVSHNSWQFPKFSGTTLFFLALTFLCLGFNIFFHDVPWTTPHVLDRLSFLILTLFFFRYFQNQTHLHDVLIPLFLSTSLVLGIGYAQLFGLGTFLPANISISATFGNINMIAEFVGIAFLFKLYSLVSLSKDHPFLRTWGYILAVLTLSFLYFTHCRSVTIASFGAIGLIYACQKGVPKKQILGIVLLSILLIVFVNFIKNVGYGWVLSKTGSDYIIKTSSTIGRWDILVNALNTFLHHPFGIGIGRYEFSVMPYQIASLQQREFFTHTSPHCEPLRLLMEDGIHVFLAGGLFFLSFIWSSWSKLKLLFTNVTSVYILAVILHLLLESLFQFPLDMASPFFFSALALGYVLAKGTEPIELKGAFKLKAISFLLMGTSLIYLAGAQIVSRYYDFMFPFSYDKSLMAAKLNPGNFFAYRNLIALDLKKRDLRAARTHIKEALRASPYNFLILKDLAALSYFEQNQPQECQVVFLYDQMFHQTSTLNSQISNICSLEDIQTLSQKSISENYQSLLEEI